MSKVSNCIKFLKILGNGRKMNIAELSKVLEVSPRMIRQYKQDLELAGYYIETISGRYGGYVINSQKTKNFDKFLDIYDLQLLERIEQKFSFQISSNDSVKLAGLIERLRNELFYYEKINKFSKIENSEIKIDIFYYAIKNNFNIRIKYFKNKKIVEKIFSPKYVSLYKNSFFITGLVSDLIRTFYLKEITFVEII